jgi:hypothetical protein
MTIPAVLLTLSYIFFAHYMADFVFQTSWMATNKSKSLKALSAHIASYATVLMFFGFGFSWFTETSFLLVAQYVLLNAGLHMATDFVTSKGSSWAFANQKIELFWSIIGFDQFVHNVTFVLTLAYFLG